MGVVVKTILPGGVADRDGRLQSGDHILQVRRLMLYFDLVNCLFFGITDRGGESTRNGI